ncbi:MAG: hypothetical protein AAF551_07515 [Bacteroidota bacterium]
MKKWKNSELLINNFIQFIFIFSSVYFAFWLSNLAELKRVKNIEKKAIESVHKELKENLAQLNKAYDFHYDIRNRSFAYADSIENGVIDPVSLKPRHHLSKIFTRESNSLGFPSLNRNSWETLKRSEAYMTLDYELASTIGKLYSIQEKGVEITMQKIISEIFNNKSLFREDESEAIIFLTAWSFRELAGQEQYLMKVITNSLVEIEKYYPELKNER